MPHIKSLKVVAVTGAAGYIGQRLLERLDKETSIETIVATDNRPLGSTYNKVVFYQQEITHSLTQAFKKHKVEAVVHLAFALRQKRSRKLGEKVNISGASSLLQSCNEAGVKRIVQLSSSTVYGPHPDNPIFLQEDDPIRPPYQFQYAWDKALSEHLFQEYGARHPDSDVSVLRSCIVMGPNANNFITSALLKPLLIGIKGCNPPIQFVHEQDLVEVIWKFLSTSHPGVFNVAGRDVIKWADVVKASRRPSVWLSPKLIYGVTALAWFLHLQNESPPKGVDFIRWPWVISTDRIEEELHYRCKFTSKEALFSFLDTRYSAS